MDIFAECLVRRRLTQKESIFRSLIWGTILFVLFFFGICGFFYNQYLFLILFLFATTMLILDKYYFHKVTVRLSSVIEYEYTIVNSELDLDKIVGKEERTRLLTVNIKNVELFAPVKLMHENELNRSNFKTVADASIAPDDESTYVLICEHDLYGRTLIYFSPNEAFLKVFAPCVRSKTRTA